MIKSAARLKRLVPDAISVTDPLAFTGCGGRDTGSDEDTGRRTALTATNTAANAPSVARKFVGGLPSRNGISRGTPARYIPSPSGAAGFPWPSMRWRPRPTRSSRRSSGAARWRPPMSNCPPVTDCRSRPALRRCA
ncbi:putative membrane mmpL11 domain protein [Mycobacterium xenopi 3993]|nr:putative membrane mmpL11 domain protein [Mycobacterium xenopi 3993]